MLFTDFITITMPNKNIVHYATTVIALNFGSLDHDNQLL